MTIETQVKFSTGRAGQKRMGKIEDIVKPERTVPERIPRVARLMALAIHFDSLIRRGVVRDYADLARMGGLTRARVTQIMNLLNLAPEIQEKLLFLHGAEKGRDSITERNLRALMGKTRWDEQHRLAPLI